MVGQTYYLSSLESTLFEPVRKCTFLKEMSFDTGKECFVAEITPPVVGQNFGMPQDIEYVVLASRHEGRKLSSIGKFPCFVFITHPLSDEVLHKDQVTKEDFQILAWGELYRTRQDAQNKVFD